MNKSLVLFSVCSVAPAILMMLVGLISFWGRISLPQIWRVFVANSLASLLVTLVLVVFLIPAEFSEEISFRLSIFNGALEASVLSSFVALLVQLLGTVIGGFSARYLQGEEGQRNYVSSFAIVLASVNILLLGNHWLILVASWIMIGIALQSLLCFYPDRPFARLAAHKKYIADRFADGLLVTATLLSWLEVGSGSFSDLWAYLNRYGISVPLQLSALCLVLAVILRTALFPVHGWLTQVMEAPTPVSALLHAGVVNLGGFVLIRFAPLLEQATPARTLVVGFGLTTAILAGMVMITRVSIKVRLAWSTTAQMGFMMLECGLGLYTLATLHLIGHSLYKAHAFLSASSVVRQAYFDNLRRFYKNRGSSISVFSLILAPAVTMCAVVLVQLVAGVESWPGWWSIVLALAWAPLFWLPAQRLSFLALGWQLIFGISLVLIFSAACLLAHILPLGIQDSPHHGLGIVALVGMATLYLVLSLIKWNTQSLSKWRRLCYAGFYVDEVYTHWALKIWPTQWMPKSNQVIITRSPALDWADEVR